MHFMITGERGIGKSSLLNFLKHAAQGKIPLGGPQVRFLVADVAIERTTTQLGLLERVSLAIRRELDRIERGRHLANEVWQFVKRIEAAGFRFHNHEKVEHRELALEEFAQFIINIVERICTDGAEDLFNARFDGLLILIDEGDRASKDLDLGSLCKLLTERLQRSGCNRVMLALAGLPHLRRVLSESHESALRIFEHLPLGRLSEGEVEAVIDLCLEEANRINATPTTLGQSGQRALVMLAEGYPHFIQQFGYSAFDVDDDDLIDRADVIKGASGKHGALRLIGDRYYHDDFYKRIQKDSYRRVLRIMADRLDDWISKAEIRSQFQGDDATLDRAIKVLRDRDIILSREGERGVYRLQHKGFALWIKQYTTKKAEIEREPGTG